MTNRRLTDHLAAALDSDDSPLLECARIACAAQRIADELRQAQAQLEAVRARYNEVMADIAIGQAVLAILERDCGS